MRLNKVDLPATVGADHGMTLAFADDEVDPTDDLG